MSNPHLSIRLDNTKIDLTNTISLAYDKTNLPKQAFKFKVTKPLFWKLEQKHYDSASKTLTVNVVDYNLTTDLKLHEQEPKHPINRLKFEKLDWEKFEPLLFTYQLGQLKSSIFNYQDRLLDMSDDKSEDVKALKRTAPNLFFSKRESFKEEVIIELKVKYEDARFDTSKIIFTVQLKPYKLIKQLEVINLNLRPEFEYIKSYFVKRLGKSFLAKIKLTFLDTKVEEIVADSDDINLIDETFINSIKTASILNLKHFKTDRDNKILYGTQELSAEDKGLSILNTSAKDILEVFIEDGKVRNVKQLEYLARDKQSLNERIQFTIKPLFGFVFSENKTKQCFIWELLNSHATYVWKSKDTSDKLVLNQMVEQAIATIQNDGREAYKTYFKTLKNPTYNFGVIDHSSNNMTDDERFSEWRKKLERFCL